MSDAELHRRYVGMLKMRIRALRSKMAEIQSKRDILEQGRALLILEREKIEHDIAVIEEIDRLVAVEP